MRCFSSSQTASENRLKPFLFSLFWYSGLVFGLYSFFCSDFYSIQLMRRSLTAPVSIVSLAKIYTLPLLFIFLFSLYGIPWIVYLYGFANAAAFSFLSIGILSAFCSANWLIWFLIMIFDCLVSTAFCFFVFRSFRRYCIWNLFCFTFVLLAIAVIEYCLVLPFGAILIEI